MLLAISYSVDHDSLYLIVVVWVSSGVFLVMIAAIMVVWLEVNCVCVCMHVSVCACSCS